MKHRQAILVLLTVAATFVLAHEGHAPLPSKGSDVDLARGLIRLSGDAREALDVQVIEIGTTPPPADSVLAYASLVSSWKGHAFAVSRLPGQIIALHAKPGDQVAVGALLAEVQSQELESLQLEVQNAQTNARLAEQVYKGVKESIGAIPEREIINAEIQLQQARNALELARVKWLALGLSPTALDALLAGTAKPTPTLPIRSPVSGTVIHADLALGKVVEPGEHLFEVIDLSSIWARIGVLEKDITRVAVGQPVEVRLTAYPGDVFHGTVAVVGQFLDPTTHLIDVWVEYRVSPGRAQLLPGMYGQARIEMPAVTGTQSIPAAALINDGVDRFVLVEEARTADVSEYRKKSVVVVRETSDTVEVRSPDLFPGDRVVTRGGHELGTFFAPGVLRLTPESTQSIGLKVEPVGLHPVETVIEVPGALELPPDHRSVAAARLPGAISAIMVDRGQRVQAGDIVAEVFSLDLLNLQLDLLREHLAADLAGQQLERLKIANDSVPKRRLIEAEAEYVATANRRDSLRRRLALVGLTNNQLDMLVRNREVVPTLPVRATVAGNVVSFDQVIGQSVRADEPLFEIHDLARPWIQGFVSEQELRRVRVGQSARVRVVGGPGLVLEGTVVRSGRTFGLTHRTLTVWVELDRDPPIPLRHNQMARLSLIVEAHPPTLAVPVGALVRDGTRTFVFVQVGETFDRREITLGRIDDRHAEVTAGLVLGEPIAVTAADALHTAWASVR